LGKKEAKGKKGLLGNKFKGNSITYEWKTLSQKSKKGAWQKKKKRRGAENFERGSSSIKKKSQIKNPMTSGRAKPWRNNLKRSKRFEGEKAGGP